MENCICGGGWSGTVSRKGHAVILKYWNEIHSGDGHALCEARLAARKRAASMTLENIMLRRNADCR